MMMWEVMDMSGSKTPYQILEGHCGKSIMSVEQVGKHIKIMFYDLTSLVLLDAGCNTCGGFTLEGMDHDEN